MSTSGSQRQTHDRPPIPSFSVSVELDIGKELSASQSVDGGSDSEDSNRRWSNGRHPFMNDRQFTQDEEFHDDDNEEEKENGKHHMIGKQRLFQGNLKGKTLQDVEDDSSDSSNFSYGDDEESSSEDDDEGDTDDDDEDDDHPEENQKLSLEERMIRNQKRNAQFLESLNEKYHIPDHAGGGNRKRKLKENTAGETTTTMMDSPVKQSRGMLKRSRIHKGIGSETTKSNIYTAEDSTLLFPERVRILLNKFPQRESQIRRLMCLLHASIIAGGTTATTTAATTTTGSSTFPQQPQHQQSRSSATVHVPAPIFLTGPTSTGKTSVMKGVLNVLKTETKLRHYHASAYLHCGTMEPTSVERLVVDAYRQLRTSILADEEGTIFSFVGRSRRSKRRRQQGPKLPSSPSRGPQQQPPPTTTATSAAQDSQQMTTTATAQSDQTSTGDIDLRPRLQPRRAVKENTLGASSSTKPKGTSLTTRNALKKPTVRKGQSSSMDDTDPNHHDGEDQVETSHSAIVAFGRSLRRYFGPGSGRAAILVLDDAERLLTLSGRKNVGDKSNALAELLLLPKVMRLNLTIIVISKYSLLLHTRLDNRTSGDKSGPNSLMDNGASGERSVATLMDVVVGLTIQFPAYNTHDGLLQVLKTEAILALIVGRKADHPSSGSFLNKAIDAFLTSLVQILSDTTIDINEYVRIGRSLWPTYIQPMESQTIRETLKVIDIDLNGDETPTEKDDTQILGLLSRRFLSQIGKISRVLTTLSIDSTGSVVRTFPSRPTNLCDFELPFLQICLLLASFICQKNRAENDQKVFSVHGNGKRRKSKKGDESNEDNTAFATAGSGIEKLRSLRPRPFLVERVYSIFVTLIRLNPDSVPKILGTTKRIEFSVDTLGTTRLYEDFRRLMDLGYIHEAGFTSDTKGEEINLNGARYWCSLTDQQASDLARSVNIPLDSYLV